MYPPFGVDYSGMTTEELWEHYELCCKRHDWTFEYADDHRSWLNGTQERDYLYHLKQHMETLDSSKSVAIYQQYSPFKL